MALATFSDLKLAVASWLNREDTDFLARVPDFITGCEQMVNYGFGDLAPLRVGEMEKTALIALQDGAALLPDDYLEGRLFRSTVYPYGELDFETPGQAAGNYANYAGGYDPPAAATLLYYAKIPALSEASPTNWLLTKAPMVYLYGSLVHSAPFESEDARMQSWLTLYSAAIAGLKSSDIGARYVNARSRVRGPTP